MSTPSSPSSQSARHSPARFSPECKLQNRYHTGLMWRRLQRVSEQSFMRRSLCCFLNISSVGLSPVSSHLRANSGAPVPAAACPATSSCCRAKSGRNHRCRRACVTRQVGFHLRSARSQFTEQYHLQVQWAEGCVDSRCQPHSQTPFGARREVACLLAQRCLFVSDEWVEKGH